MSALEHPLVARYLRELDLALDRLPPDAAAELAEQIRAHLEEALPPDADDQAVAAVLAALGPASLVAEAAGPDAGPGRDTAGAAEEPHREIGEEGTDHRLASDRRPGHRHRAAIRHGDLLADAVEPSVPD